MKTNISKDFTEQARTLRRMAKTTNDQYARAVFEALADAYEASQAKPKAKER